MTQAVTESPGPERGQAFQLTAVPLTVQAFSALVTILFRVGLPCAHAVVSRRTDPMFPCGIRCIDPDVRIGSRSVRSCHKMIIVENETGYQCTRVYEGIGMFAGKVWIPESRMTGGYSGYKNKVSGFDRPEAALYR